MELKGLAAAEERAAVVAMVKVSDFQNGNVESPDCAERGA